METAICLSWHLKELSGLWDNVAQRALSLSRMMRWVAFVLSSSIKKIAPPPMRAHAPGGQSMAAVDLGDSAMAGRAADRATGRTSPSARAERFRSPWDAKDANANANANLNSSFDNNNNTSHKYATTQAGTDTDQDPLDLLLETNGADSGGGSDGEGYEPELYDDARSGRMFYFRWFHSLHLTVRLVLALVAGTLVFGLPAAIILAMHPELSPDLGQYNFRRESGQLSYQGQLVRWSIWATCSCDLWTGLYYSVSAIPIIIERTSVWIHGDVSERVRSLLEYFPALRFWIVQVLWMASNLAAFAIIFPQMNIVPYWRSAFLALCVLFVFLVCLFFQRLSVQAIAFNFHCASHEGRIAQYKLAIRTLERLRKALKAAAKREAVERAYARAAYAFASAGNVGDGSIHASVSANGNTIGSIRKLFDLSTSSQHAASPPPNASSKTAAGASALAASAATDNLAVPSPNSASGLLHPVDATTVNHVGWAPVRSVVTHTGLGSPFMLNTRPPPGSPSAHPVEMQILISHGGDQSATEHAPSSAPASASSYLGATTHHAEIPVADGSNPTDRHNSHENYLKSADHIDISASGMDMSAVGSSTEHILPTQRAADNLAQGSEQQARRRVGLFANRTTQASPTISRLEVPQTGHSSISDPNRSVRSTYTESRMPTPSFADPAAAAELLSKSRKMQHHRMIASSIMIGGHKYIKRVQGFEQISYKNAVKLAHKLFVALGGTIEHEIDLDSFRPYFPNEASAREAFGLFDRDKNGSLSEWELKRAILHIYQERHNLFCSLRDLSQALGRLNQALYVLSILVTAFISLPIYGISLDVLVPLASILVALGVAFGSSAKTTIDCIVFLFVTHPYDSGDRVIIDGQNMRVVELHLLSTVFERMDGQRVYAQNAILSQKQINNVRRSGDQIELIELLIHFGTPEATMRQLQSRMLDFVKSRPRDYIPQCDLTITALEPLINKIRCQFWLRYKGNWQDSSKRFSRRNAFFYALKQHLIELQVVGDVSSALGTTAGLVSELSSPNFMHLKS